LHTCLVVVTGCGGLWSQLAESVQMFFVVVSVILGVIGVVLADTLGLGLDCMTELLEGVPKTGLAKLLMLSDE